MKSLPLMLPLLLGLSACGSTSLSQPSPDGPSADTAMADVASAVDAGTSDADLRPAADGAVDTAIAADSAFAVDVAAPDGGPDLVPQADLATTFPARLYDGIWTVGWSGGLIHESWVRFTPDASGMAGTFATAPVKCRACTTYFRVSGPSGADCAGSDGLFTVGAGGQVTLQLPSACMPAANVIWTFDEFEAGGRPLVIETARVRTTAGGISSLQGAKYRRDHCGADLTTCPDPYQF